MSRFLRDVARGYTCIMARPPPRRNDFVGRSVAIYRWRSWAAEALAPTALEVLRGIISGRDVAMRRAGRGSRAWKAGYLQVSDSMTTGVKPRSRPVLSYLGHPRHDSVISDTVYSVAMEDMNDHIDTSR